ncbi:MAG TPA: bifunctional phosphopantothenoylcysteine decarboxylase/phosphopantothenate--cysteine ligase CoaBC, partial [Desulfobacteraceae bacterium]|nr:bifunctional phosphopantothenoylcysteine decarboxylase/phosphopantothenate--cysteine ligase CoaBC [Desulfobacteraceae bacterium]
MSLKDKRIVIGISGGIAAYKAVELVRLLISGGAKVRVCMTKNGTKFVTPLTFEAITGEKVIWDMFSQEGPEMLHISWARYGDLIAIAPATANIISKLAHGIADDFLTTMILAAGCPILICPSMNSKMYQNPVISQNIELLRNRGIRVMEPSEGELACGEIGPGRLPDPEDILYEIRYLLSSKDLEGRRIVVTAGPTWEAIDPVRFITNRSSGKMGYALAREAYLRGAEVALISGPSNERPPRGVEFVEINSAREMKDAVIDRAEGADAIIKAAAVSDYRPRYMAKSKIKKGLESLTIELVKNPDILSELGKKRSK